MPATKSKKYGTLNGKKIDLSTVDALSPDERSQVMVDGVRPWRFAGDGDEVAVRDGKIVL